MARLTFAPKAFPMYRQSFYPAGRGEDRGKLSIEGNDEAIEEVKKRMEYRP